MFKIIILGVAHRVAHRVAHKVAHRVAHGLAHGPRPRFCPHPAQRKTIPVSTQASKKFLFNLARLIRALIFGIVLHEWLINATKFTIVRSKCFNYYQYFNFFVKIIVSFPSY